MNEECIFCKIAKGEIKSEKIYENEKFFSIYDIKPFTKGHCLIISKKHFSSFLEFPEEDCSEFLDCLKKTSEILIEKHGAEGFNVINNNGKVANQEIAHFHVHLVPRTKGDGFKIAG